MNRFIRSIVRWWRLEHPPLAKCNSWKRAWQAERRAKASGCTRDIHKARIAMRVALHANLAGRS